MTELGDAPIQQAYREKMNAFASIVDRYFNEDPKNPKVGFCLMLFNFEGEDRRANYISNAQRKDVIELLREQLKRFESQK